MASCTEFYSAEDQDGNDVQETYFDLYSWNGSFWEYIDTLTIPSGALNSMTLPKGSKFRGYAEPIPGYTTPSVVEITACMSDMTFVYKKIATECTQSFTASASIGELPFTPQVFIFEGDIADPNKVVGIWDIPANVPDLGIDNTYLAYPIIPSSYTGDDFTCPEEEIFTACTSTIDFVYTKTEDQNGGVYTVLIPVLSTNLKAAGWTQFDQGLSILEVEFLSGSLYMYYYVPKSIFEGLMSAPSKGFYFWLYIRCKTFDCSGGDIPYDYEKLR